MEGGKNHDRTREMAHRFSGSIHKYFHAKRKKKETPGGEGRRSLIGFLNHQREVLGKSGSGKKCERD